MKSKIAVICIAVLVFGLVVSCYGAESQASFNVYRLGSILPADWNAWKPLAGTKIRLSQQGKGDPYFTLEVQFDVSKAGNAIRGIHRENLKLRTPLEVRFMAYAQTPILWVVLKDKQGHTFTSQAPYPAKSEEWFQVAVPIKAGALQNLDSIAILSMDAAGENPVSGPKIYRFSNFEIVYPEGKGPQNPKFEKADIDNTLKPLDTEIPKIEALMSKAKALGAETRYFDTSLAVLKRYRKEALDMAPDHDPLIAKRTAAFLLKCAARTEKNLQVAIAQPQKSIRVPYIQFKNLKVRNGSFYSGTKPVMLLGQCGWFNNAAEFDYLANLGISEISMETGPSSTLVAEDKTSPENLSQLLTNFDMAASRNIAVDFLLSPHYVPQWAYDKWPDLDPEYRHNNNPFMPWDVRSPHLKELISKHLSVILPLVKNKPSLLAYDLINEAWYRPFYNLTESEQSDYMKSNPKATKWNVPQQYAVDKVTQFVKWYVDEAKKLDPSHPAYIKVLTSEETQGVDREALGDVLSANGMDSYPVYPDPTGELAADFAWVLARLDFHRSLTPNKPILDGEYHVFNGTYPHPDSFVRTALWAAALHGKDAAALWVYNRVDQVSVDWHANGVEVLGHTALDFTRLAPEIQAFQRATSPLALLYGGSGFREAYLAASFLDSDVGIVTPKRIGAGVLSRYKLLIVPFGCPIDKSTRAAINAFKTAGGQVIECGQGVARSLWPSINKAAQVCLKSPIRVNKWGVEARSTSIGKRKLVYLINYNRQAITLDLSASYPKSELLELRTQARRSAKKVVLGSLQTQVLEVQTGVSK